MTIKARLFTGFSTVLFMMLALTMVGIQQVNQIDRSLTEITDVNSVKQRYAINFRGSVHDRAIAIRDVVLVSPGELNPVIDEIRTLEDFYRDSAVELDSIMNSSMDVSNREREILNEIKSIERTTLPLIEQIVQAKKSDNLEQATDLLLQRARPQFVNWLATINEFIDYQEAANKKATEETRMVTGNFQNWMIVLTAIAVALGVAVAYFISQKVRESVGGEPQQAALVVAEIANGDLTNTIDNNVPDSMMASVEIMQKQLRLTVNNIATSADELTQRAEALAASSQHALTAADQQVAHTSDAVRNLESMSDSIRSVADTMHQTEENSKVTADLSQQGREAVQKVASEIEEISTTTKATVEQVNILDERAREIGDIVNVIRGISEQTNLLALNAAIEAARAGESGRGFAVVADEVRQLAQRTGDATGEIEQMINQVQENTQASVQAMQRTVPKVESGLQLTREANQLLGDIQTQADDSLAKVLEVAQATTSQVKTVNAIVNGVEEIAQMSKDTSVSLKDNAEGAAALEQLSGKLKQDVDYFSVS